MCGEGDVFGVGLGYPAGAREEAGFEEELVGVWQLALADDVLRKGVFQVSAEPDFGRLSMSRQSTGSESTMARQDLETQEARRRVGNGR
jgi:hypothetical protein